MDLKVIKATLYVELLQKIDILIRNKQAKAETSKETDEFITGYCAAIQDVIKLITEEL